MAKERWLSAKEARALVNQLNRRAQDVAAAQLARWSAHGIVRSRCTRWIEISEMSGKRTFLDVKEMADFWEGYQTGAGLTDWEHGEFSAHKYDPVYGATSNTVYGVEFCANDIETHLKPQSQDPYQTAIDRLVGQEVRLSDVVRSRLTPPPTPPPSPPLAVDPVAPAEIDAWYAALAPNEKAMGLRWLHDRARADHPGRKVVRKLVEKFVEGRKTGRPSGR